MKNLKVNGANIIFENNADTPRSAIHLYFTSNKPKPHNAAHVLLGNLLLQGTDKKSAEEIALEAEKLGIEISISSGVDFLKVAILCLNEDIEPALDIVNEFMTGANFATFEKEVFRFKNETISSLDSPVTKALDAFNKKLYENHRYGITNSKLLETLNSLTVDDVKKYYSNLLCGNKLISIAANIKNEDEFLSLISNKLKFMQNSVEEDIPVETIHHKGGFVKIEKADAKQAQIFQGWIVPGLNSADSPKLSVLNTLLGNAGLSSRLFVELRDKKGLAYTVRSSYKTLKHSANFVLYIGTEPSNIQKSLAGFKTEIERIITQPPNDEELQGAIENIIGRFKYFNTQTNTQIANENGWNGITGLGFDYSEKMLEKIKKVTPQDVVEVTKKYLLKEPVITVLAPKEYLNF